jgi:hypothetical protein
MLGGSFFTAPIPGLATKPKEPQPEAEHAASVLHEAPPPTDPHSDPHKLASTLGGNSAVSQLKQLQHDASPFAPITASPFQAQTNLQSALARDAGKPGVANIAHQEAEKLRASGDYQSADAIANLSPNFKSSEQTLGEARARHSVDVSTVADKRKSVESTMTAGRDATVSQADKLWAQAVDKKTAPGTQSKITGDTALITKKDDHGNITSSERVSFSGGATTIESTSFETSGGKSVETTNRSTVGTDGKLTETQASQPGMPTKSAPGALNDTALQNDRTGNVSYDKTTFSEGGGRLTTSEMSSKGGVSTESTSQYWKEDSLSVDDKLKGAFNQDTHSVGPMHAVPRGPGFQDQALNVPVDKEETKTYTIGGAGGPSYTRALATSQGSGNSAVQATSTATNKLADPITNVCEANHTLGDVAKMQAANKNDEGFDGSSQSPKQWLLEKSSGDEYKSQSFVEGHTDASVITDRTAFGSTVHEDQSGKWFDKEGKVSPVSSTSNTTYAANGLTQHIDAKSTNGDGSETKLFNRSGNKESLVVTDTPTGGKQSGYFEHEESKDGHVGADGLQQGLFGGLAGTKGVEEALKLSDPNLNPLDARDRIAGLNFLKGGTGALASVPGAVIAGENLKEAIASGDALQIGSAGAGTVQAGAGVGSAILDNVGAFKTGVTGVQAGRGALGASETLGKFGMGAGIAAGGLQAIDGIVNGNTSDIAKGGINIAGTVGTGLLADAAAGAVGGSWGGPVGVGVGLLGGLATFGATKLVDAIGDDSHQIADRKI